MAQGHLTHLMGAAESACRHSEGFRREGDYKAVYSGLYGVLGMTAFSVSTTLSESVVSAVDSIPTDSSTAIY